MKAWRLTAPGLENLQRMDTSRPVPAYGEVLIRQHAVSLNYLDLAVAQGSFGNGLFPIIPAADSAGEIVEIGEGVDDWRPGARVTVGSMLRWQAGPLAAPLHQHLRGVTVDGGLAEYAVVPAAALASVPSHLNWEEASTLPIAATTAWNAIRKGGVSIGATVLLLGTGGVSMYALAMAKAAGARVIIISSSDEKLLRAKRLGADNMINYRKTPDWDDEVLKLTEGRGADLVLESVGAATFPKSLNSAGYGATIFVIGFVGGAELNIPVMPIMLKTLSIVGNNTGSTQDLRNAIFAINHAEIRPVIDRVFSFDEVPLAYQHMASAVHVGKIAIRIA